MAKKNMPGLSTQSEQSVPSEKNSRSDSWLCLITSIPNHRGVMSLTEEQYFDLIDRSGLIVRAGKKGTINPDLAPILLRIEIKPESWIDTIIKFGEKFCVAVGTDASMKEFARKIGVRWLVDGPIARRFV